MSDDEPLEFEFGGVDPRDPYIVAWKEQFGALVRDKVRQMINAIEVTGWNELAHCFDDPYDDDRFHLTFYNGEFYLVNLSTPQTHVRLDLEKLGVIR